ncbi:hypothetical protein AVEN_115795-1 [Araneus ventricosus]|uniref:Reverse transcriptase domain-containing protein n=1 Tax=Araneus ventricosus TaxID=182803 RepID=A0A4Y2RSR4_ARAVE|nr:hypothetical protein AVEN_115795-1 [Araneus ventricosus]
MNNHIINCFFVDDTAILAQGSTSKFMIRTLQRGLIEIEKWCTLRHVTINADKTGPVMFHKGHPRNNLQSLTFFEEELSWDKEVKYHGLILDSKLTFRSHIKYNTDKFWAKVHVIIPLIGRKSPLSLNKDYCFLYLCYVFSCIFVNKPSFSIILRVGLFTPYTTERPFCNTGAKSGIVCMVNTRSQTEMADNADLLALLAEMKKSMEKGQEESNPRCKRKDWGSKE